MGRHRLLAALQALRQRAAEAVRLRPVEAVLADGTVEVGGVRVPVSGRGQPVAGEVVPVIEREGRPLLVLAHRAARAQAGGPMAAPEAPVLEELFVAEDAQGRRDIVYRNATQVTPLRLWRWIPADERIRQIRWGEAFPESGQTVAEPDPRTLCVVWTERGEPETEPGNGTLEERFYVVRLRGKRPARAQTAPVEAELVRVETTAGSPIVLLDWTVDLTETPGATTVVQLRQTVTETFTACRGRWYLTSREWGEVTAQLLSETPPPGFMHLRRTLTLGRLVPGLIAPDWDEWAQALVHDVWMEPETGHLLLALTLELVSWPEWNAAYGDTGGQTTVVAELAGARNEQVQFRQVSSPWPPLTVRMHPEAHALVVDLTGGEVRWTSAGSVGRTLTSSVTETGARTVLVHVVTNYQTNHPERQGLVGESGRWAWLVPGTPPGPELRRVEVSGARVDDRRSDGFGDGGPVDRDGMYEWTSGTTVTEGYVEFTTGRYVGTLDGACRLTIVEASEVLGHAWVRWVWTTQVRTKRRPVRCLDLRLVRWRRTPAEQRLWLGLWQRDGVGFRQERARPGLIDGQGAVVAWLDAPRRYWVLTSPPGGYQQGFLRPLSWSAHHLLYRALLGASGEDAMPRDEVWLVDVDGLRTRRVVAFPAAPTGGGVGTVDWDWIDGVFSQIEHAQAFFQEADLRVIARDWLLRTVEPEAFIVGWSLRTGEPTLEATDLSALTRDAAMTRLARMRPVGAALRRVEDPVRGELVTPLEGPVAPVTTVDTPLYASAWRVINDRAVLGPAGRFRPS